MQQDTAKNGYLPANGEVSRAEFEALADAHNLTIADGENRRGPNPFTGEGENGFCWRWPELNGHDRSGSFKKSRREMLDFFGVGTSRYSQQGAQNGHFSEFYPPIKPLEARGLTGETLRFFGVVRIQSAKWNGWKYPTFHSDKTQARDRFKNATGKPKYAWWKSGDGREPDAYNLQNIPDGISEVWAVGGEVDVWAMHQNGFEAVAPFGETQGASRLVGALLQKRAGRIRILLDNDDAGRAGAAALARECEQQGLSFCVHEFSGADGHDVCDEFSRVGFDRERFRAAILALPEIEIENVSDGAQNSTSAPSKQAFEFHTLAQLAARPAPQWLIHRLLTCGGTSLLTAKHASFKSFIALDMALSIACDRPWQGFEVKSGKVLYIAAEGAAGLTKRALAWQAHHDAEAGENFVVLDVPLKLHDPQTRAEFIGAIGAIAPTLIVLDTLARCAVGLDENNSGDMGVFADAVGELAKVTGAHVMTVHHNNKNGDYRGSSALPAAVDTHLSLDRNREGDAALVFLKTEKQKDFEELETLTFEGREVAIPGTQGKGFSLVFEKLDTRAGDATSLSSSEKKVLNELCNGFGAEGASASQWGKICEEAGIANRTFRYAKEKLVKIGAVSCPEKGARGAKFFPSGDFEPIRAIGAKSGQLPDCPNASESRGNRGNTPLGVAPSCPDSEDVAAPEVKTQKLNEGAKGADADFYGAANPCQDLATHRAARDFAANFGDSEISGAEIEEREVGAI